MKKVEKNVDMCESDVVHASVVERVRAALPDEDTLADVAELFKVFGDSSRIRILFVLFEAEVCVCDLAEALRMTQSAVSHQLGILKVGWDGKWEYSVTRANGRWRSVVTVPVATLGVKKPLPGTKWYLNLGRETFKGGAEPQLQLWNPSIPPTAMPIAAPVFAPATTPPGPPNKPIAPPKIPAVLKPAKVAILIPNGPGVDSERAIISTN